MPLAPAREKCGRNPLKNPRTKTSEVEINEKYGIRREKNTCTEINCESFPARKAVKKSCYEFAPIFLL
jgi:hypothetical protein